MTFSRRALLQTTLLGLSGLAAGPLRAAQNRPMRILILGGTGFVGPHLVRAALADGHQVTLFNRGRQPLKWPQPVEQLVGDRTSGDLHALEGRDWDVCIDVPTTLPAWVRDMGKVLHGRIRQYVFISTISVYADPGKPGDESAPLAPYTGANAMAETAQTERASRGTLYGPLKALSEQQARDHFPGAATIIRPGLIVGPGDPTDRFTYWPVRLHRGGEVLAPGDGKDPAQIIDVRDLAEWILRLAERRVVGTFNATGPAQPLTTSGMLQAVAHAIHAHARLTWVPARFLEAEQVEPWSDMPAWLPRAGDHGALLQRSNARALAAGLTLRPLGETATATLDWFAMQSPARQAAVKAGLPAARERAVLAAWHARKPANVSKFPHQGES